MLNTAYHFFTRLFPYPLTDSFSKTKSHERSKYENYLYELKHLVSVTQTDYQELYAKLIKTVEIYLIDKPELFLHSLERSITTLKIRRAYMLPIGEDAETCYAQQDVWTYALFSAALLMDRIASHKEPITIAEKLMPERGFNWIKENKFLCEEWFEFLKGENSENNLFAKIIFQQEGLPRSLVGNKNKKEKTNCAESKKDSECPENISSHSKISSLSNGETLVELNSIQQNEIINSENKIVTSQKNIAEPVTESVTDKFILWIKDSVKENKLPINQIDSSIQHVNDGILLSMPMLYNDFLKENGFSLNPSEKKKLLNEILQDEKFIQKNSQNPLHTYFCGEWNARNQIEGLLVSPLVLFDENAVPEINDKWIMDVV
jgi:hypothetical protein